MLLNPRKRQKCETSASDTVIDQLDQNLPASGSGIVTERATSMDEERIKPALPRDKDELPPDVVIVDETKSIDVSLSEMNMM